MKQLSTSCKLSLQSMGARIVSLDKQIIILHQELYRITPHQDTYVIRGIVHKLNCRLYRELTSTKYRK